MHCLCAWGIRKEIANPTLVNDCGYRGIQRGNSPAIFTVGDQEPQKQKLQREADRKQHSEK